MMFTIFMRMFGVMHGHSLFSSFWFCSDCSFDLHIVTHILELSLTLISDLNYFHKQCGHESTPLLEYEVHIYLPKFVVKQHRIR